ncbi:carbohydrate ABC transporter permease [Paenibacillus yanchengensis]|uniref:Carbohydrate ABC transporter permease n=1 Tax=Paenibacillus yanchengensis TaxID=2035833 RepID=A0ABW4YQM8_9BACL
MKNKLYQREIVPWLFMLPAVIGFIFFVWHPFVKGFYIAFTDYVPGRSSISWVGIQNFKDVFADKLFYISWKNTLYFMVMSLALCFTMAIIFAICMNEMRRMKSLFRVVLYLPSVVPAVISSLLWIWIFNPTKLGMLNMLLGRFGIEPQPFISSPSQAMPSLLLMTIWGSVGYIAIIFLAALQGVRADLYEASEIDGASLFRKIWHVTLPGIRPVIEMMFILTLINGIKFFTEPFLMTVGGPVNSTLTVMLLNYNYAFVMLEYSKATAQAIITFVVIMLFTLLYFRMIRQEN